MTPRLVFKWTSYALVALAFYFFLTELGKRLAEIPPIRWDAWGVAAAVLSVAGVVLTIALNGVMWRALLKDQGVDLAPSMAKQIIAIAQFGKYLPGNVGHFAGRAALGHAAGIPYTVTLGTILIETVWNLAIGTGFAAVALLLYSDSLRSYLPHGIGQLELGGLTLGLMFLPWFGIVMLNRLFPALSRRLGGGSPVVTPSLKTSFSVGVIILSGFLILGGILKLQAMWLFGVESGDFLTLTSLFVASWLVGYVIPGAPGGVGVREAMMVVLFTPVVGAGPAVGLGISMRLATMLGDSVAFLLGLSSRKSLKATRV